MSKMITLFRPYGQRTSTSASKSKKVHLAECNFFNKRILIFPIKITY